MNEDLAARTYVVSLYLRDGTPRFTFLINAGAPLPQPGESLVYDGITFRVIERTFVYSVRHDGGVHHIVARLTVEEPDDIQETP
jgi:hypothetical protein